MQDNYTHICIVLDASGSMEIVEKDTKGSFNTFIKEQKKTSGRATLDIYQFADEARKIVDFVDLSKLQKNLMATYRCDGCTALNDAVCEAIDATSMRLESMSRDERPAKVLFVILTDGEENASQRFTNADVKRRIQHQSQANKWVFIYLGANQDSFATGGEMGIAHNMCLNVGASSAEDMSRTSRILGNVTNKLRNTKGANCFCGSMADIANEVDAEDNKSAAKPKKKSKT